MLCRSRLYFKLREAAITVPTRAQGNPRLVADRPQSLTAVPSLVSWSRPLAVSVRHRPAASCTVCFDETNGQKQHSTAALITYPRDASERAVWAVRLP